MSDEKTIFAGALAISAPEQRQAFIDRACGDYAELRARVQALVAAHQQAGSFLESSPVGAPPTLAIEPNINLAGSTIGHYKLLERIGEGGMGVVYMADQLHPVKRRVALKIIKPGLDTRRVIARFEAERQALAMMDHPSIAKVFEAGATPEGRPYFVMELVRGVPITEYCDQHHLTARQRLELFVQVCQAVQHAHQKGIIHRDLKPNNVLVTLGDADKPIPKVIDFGIAKATGEQRLTDRTLFTEFRQLIGTPLYMSPEQAEMSQLTDVDTRSDVYSLGVLLYELLTGTTPFDKQRLAKAAYDEVRRIIREEEPPRPSTRLSTLGQTIHSISAQRQTDPKKLSQTVRGELDWIVMRALEKDRARRYETANGLARDVERYLADQPVEACPPSRVYRLRKSIRRNKAAIATAGVIAAVLLVATGVSSWQAVRATRAEREVKRQQGQVTQQRDQAIAEKRRADVEAATAAGFSDFYRSLNVGFDPSGEELLRKQAEWCLEDLSTRRELAWSIFGQLMDVYRGRKEPDKLGFWRERLRDVLQMEVEATSDELRSLPAGNPRIEDLLSRRANAYRILGRFREASADFTRLNQRNTPLLFQCAMLELYLGDNTAYRDNCDRMLQGDVEDLDVPWALNALKVAGIGEDQGAPTEELRERAKQLVVRSRNSAAALLAHGIVEFRAGDHQTAANVLAACRRKLAAQYQDEQALSYVESDATAAFFLALAEQSRGDALRAQQALAVARREAAALPDITSLSASVGSPGWLTVQVAARDADIVFGKSVGAATQPAAPAPPAAPPRPQLVGAAQSMLALARSLQSTGKFEDARQVYLVALPVQRQALGDNSPEVAVTLTRLAGALRTQGDADNLNEAEKLLHQAIDTLRASGDDERLSAALHELAYVLNRQRRIEAAEEADREALALQRRAFGSNLSKYALSLAGALSKEKKYPDAEKLYREAMDLLDREGDDSTNVAEARIGLAEVVFYQNRYAEAESLLFDEDSHLRIGGRMSPRAESRLVDLAIRLSRALDKPEQRTTWSGKRLPILQAQIADETDKVKTGKDAATHHLKRGILYARTGQFAEALSDFESAMRLEPGNHWSWYYRGCILAYLGRRDQYIAHCGEMFREFGASGDHAVLNRTNKTLSLLPGGMAPEALLASAQRESRGAYDAWSGLNLALAHYRCENWESCHREAKVVLKDPSSPYRIVAAKLLIAMALERAGDHAGARSTLSDARGQLEAFPHAEEHDLAASGNLEDWLIAHTLLKEAQGLIPPAAAATPLAPSTPTAPASSP